MPHYLDTLKHVFHFNSSELAQALKKMSKTSGKPRLFLMMDIAACAAKYGAGYHDYQLCAFYRLKGRERKTYITRGVNQRLMRELNRAEYFDVFDKKENMCKTFDKFLGRDWLILPCGKEELTAFLEKHQTVFFKPSEGSGGFGVERFSQKDYPSVSARADAILKVGPGVLEEAIRQHPALMKLQPNSVNTVRITTLLCGDAAKIPYAYLRIGGGTSYVDNAHSGGMFAPIDLETGIVCGVGYNKEEEIYETHPVTGTKIEGFQIPDWEEIKKFALQLSHVVPQMRYIGWDVAVTETGPKLVEGNNFPGYDILQLPPHTPDKIGMLPHFEKLLGEK